MPLFSGDEYGTGCFSGFINYYDSTQLLYGRGTDISFFIRRYRLSDRLIDRSIHFDDDTSIETEIWDPVLGSSFEIRKVQIAY